MNESNDDIGDDDSLYHDNNEYDDIRDSLDIASSPKRSNSSSININLDEP